MLQFTQRTSSNECLYKYGWKRSGKRIQSLCYELQAHIVNEREVPLGRNVLDNALIICIVPDEKWTIDKIIETQMLLKISFRCANALMKAIVSWSFTHQSFLQTWLADQPLLVGSEERGLYLYSWSFRCNLPNLSSEYEVTPQISRIGGVLNTQHYPCWAPE